MRVVVQRVSCARVVVDTTELGQIEAGLVIFLGIGDEDNKEKIEPLVRKLLSLRIFEKEGKINLSLVDKGLEILVISQFTLLADTSKGNRPSFMRAAKPDQARVLYEGFIASCKTLYEPKKVKHGKFAADMKVSLTNDGPFTLVLDV